jgi:hypothetical protein
MLPHLGGSSPAYTPACLHLESDARDDAASKTQQQMNEFGTRQGTQKVSSGTLLRRQR